MKKIKDYFTLTDSESRGTFLLILAMLLVISSYWWIEYFVEAKEKVDFSEFKKDIAAFETAKEEPVPSQSNLLHKVKTQVKQLKNFDPNTISQKEWESLGFSKKQAASIVKYRDSYGGFSSKEDVKKLYVIDENKYKELAPYIMIKKVNPPINTNTEHKAYIPSQSLKSKIENIVIHVNTADTSAFKTIRGIGSSFAKRIVKFRDKLGGFISVEQLKEVYGMSPELIDENAHRFNIDTSYIQKININTCDAKMLKNHPYINWNIANSIVQVRKQHGSYKSIEGIKTSDLVNDEIYRKIATYLKIE